MGNVLKTSPWLYAPWKETVMALLSDDFCVDPEDSIVSIREHFEKNPGLQSQPVVSNGQPIGFIDGRSILYETSEGLLVDAKASDYMQEGVDERMVVNEKTTIDGLLHKVSHKNVDLSNGYLLVCNRDGQYVGRLILSDIIELLAALQLQNIHYANPLTRLPGQVPINEKLCELMRKDCLFVAAYCDIDGFKSYNDVYGYTRGDDVIRYIANLLQSHLDLEQDFIGHIGGDDFLIVFQSPDWFERCDAIVHQCDEEAGHFYSSVHREANGICRIERQGKTVFHPLFSLSIGAVSVEPGKFTTHHEIVAAAAEVKKRAMTTHGGTIYINERSYRNDITRQPIVCN
jgi:diguanylate cyclase (GGDEF)-like protein